MQSFTAMLLTMLLCHATSLLSTENPRDTLAQESETLVPNTGATSREFKELDKYFVFSEEEGSSYDFSDLQGYSTLNIDQLEKIRKIDKTLDRVSSGGTAIRDFVKGFAEMPIFLIDRENFKLAISEIRFEERRVSP